MFLRLAAQELLGGGDAGEPEGREGEEAKEPTNKKEFADFRARFKNTLVLSAHLLRDT